MKIYDYKGKPNIAGERIREAREALGLSLRPLAAKLQVMEVILEKTAISRIERYERFLSDYELLAFAEVLGVDVMWLLTGKGEGPSANQN